MNSSTWSPPSSLTWAWNWFHHISTFMKSMEVQVFTSSSILIHILHPFLFLSFLFPFFFSYSSLPPFNHLTVGDVKSNGQVLQIRTLFAAQNSSEGVKGGIVLLQMERTNDSEATPHTPLYPNLNIKERREGEKKRREWENGRRWSDLYRHHLMIIDRSNTTWGAV